MTDGRVGLLTSGGANPLPFLLLGLPLLGALLAGFAPLRDRAARLVGVAATGGTLVTAAVLVGRFHYAHAAFPQFLVDLRWIPALDTRFSLGVDGLSLPLVALTALLSLLCAVYLLHTKPERARALTALVCLLEVGMLGTFLALDLVVFFVFFEVVLIPMYFLIAAWGGPQRRAAATKFLLYTLLGSALMLVAFVILWRETGTFDMVALQFASAVGSPIPRAAQDVVAALLVVGFGVKSPLWPLHTWLPDAHTEAPTVGSVLLAGVLLKMGTYGFLRIAVPDARQGMSDLAPYLGALAVVGIVYGSLACFAQRDLKRLVAYSSVGHMGFVLLGIATLTPTGLNGALIGSVAHGLITGLLFFLVGSLKDRYATSEIADIGGGVLAKAPLLGGLVTVTAVASLGLPGLAGFWGEMLAMLGAFRPAAGLSRPLFLAFMAVAGVGTVLTAGYFLAMLRRVTLGIVPDRWRGAALADVSLLELAAWVPLVVLVLAVGLYPALVLGPGDAVMQLLTGHVPIRFGR